MSALERRYRTVLRVLPTSYRVVWEQDMVDTLLESVATGDPDRDEDIAAFGWPDAAEVVSILALAVRLRLGGVEAPARSFAWGQAVRTAALVGLLANALLWPLSLAQDLWIAAELLPDAVRVALSTGNSAPRWGATLDLLTLAWTPAFLAVVLGYRRAAAGWAAIAAVPSVVGGLVAVAGPGPALTVTCMGLINIAIVLALAAFHEQSPPVNRRPWLVGLVVGALWMPVPAVLFLLQVGDRIWLDLPGVLCLAWVVAAQVGRRDRPVSADLALVLLAVPVLALRLASLVGFASQLSDPVTLGLPLLHTALVVAVAVPLALRTRHRLPPADGPAALTVTTGTAP